jgi:hypothetical protein
VVASLFKKRSSHGRTSKIKAKPPIFARRISDSASHTLARVVPKSLRAPQCFDFESYFFVWWESWVKGVPGLLRDKTRPPRIPPLETEVEARMVAATQTAAPDETTHWTSPAMARHIGISVSAVQRIWRKHSLQPHRIRQFKLSNDPRFAAKLLDIVGLYVNPPEHAIVLSIDERARFRRLTGPSQACP